MKKLMMIAAMMVATMSASAQYEPGTFSIQPRVGVSASQFTNMPAINLGGSDIDSKPIGGLIAGADAEYQVNNWFSLSAGLNFSMQGSGWEDFKDKTGGSTIKYKDIKIETNVLNIPVTANFYVWKGLAVRSGVQFGFLTSAKYKAEIEGSSSGVNVDAKVDEDCKDDLKKFDIAIPVGLSYEFNNHLVIDMRYNIGLTKVNKESVSGYKDSKNGVLTLTVGYKIPL